MNAIKKLLLLGMPALLLLVSSGCAYPDLKRPPVRNYMRDRRRTERPPEPERTVAVLPDLDLSAFRGDELVSPDDYILGPGDLIAVKVMIPGALEPHLKFETTISHIGLMSCPLVGGIDVGGMNVTELKGKLTELYIDGYYTRPSVEVTVKEHRSRRALVTGYVSKPGTYPVMGERISLLHLLLEAGGVSGGAGDRIKISRASSVNSGLVPEDHAAQMEDVNLESLLKHFDLRHNIWIYPGDMVHVLPQDPPQYVYTLGFMSNSSIELPRDRELSLLDIISSAGGVQTIARAQYTYLMRYEGGELNIYDVDVTRIASGDLPDIALQANDRIIMSTDWFRRALDGFGRWGPFRTLIPSPPPIVD